MKGMLYCHICKAMGFIKSQLSSVATLDCGHMAKLKDTEAPAKTQRSKEPPIEVRRYKAPEPKPVQPPPRPAAPAGPPPRRTTNVANTLSDLLAGLGEKSRTS